MRRRRVIIVLAVFVLVAIDRQIINDSPNLEGITNVSPEGLEAVRAVRAIGTNAFPYLIRWTLDRPAWRWNLCRAYGKFPKCLQSSTVGGWILGGNDENLGLAWVGFQIMGPDEVYAVPEMARLLRDSSSDTTKRNILFCLESFTSRAHGAMPTLRDIAMQRPYRHYPSYIENGAVHLMDEIKPGSGAYIMTNVWARDPP